MTVALFIGVVTILHIIGYIVFVHWTTKVKAGGDAAEGEIIHHTWDETLQEMNNPLPGWWLKMFYLCIAIGIGYLVLYPGVFGEKYAGLLGWTEVKQYEQQKAAADAKANEYFSVYDNKSVEELAKIPEAVSAGRRIFGNNCAVCHASNAQGAALGYPNLADNDWLWGGDEQALIATITNGRNVIQGQGMPAGGALATPDDATATAVANYVHQLEGRSDYDAAEAEKGKALYDQSCIACHGPEGKGNPMLGAPNLSDNIWLYSQDGSIEDIKQQILHPANNMMPAWKDRLSEAEIKVVAAYIYSLSHQN